MEERFNISLIGKVVKYVDQNKVAYPALITWGFTAEGHGGTAAINLVYVTGDETREDSYGRQIIRETSVVHKNDQKAPGNYWIEK